MMVLRKRQRLLHSIHLGLQWQDMMQHTLYIVRFEWLMYRVSNCKMALRKRKDTGVRKRKKCIIALCGELAVDLC
jgi:hypothetical protein